MAVISYPIDRMLNTANQISDHAQNALSQHERGWEQVRTTDLQACPAFLRETLLAALTPYMQRLSDSYRWQITFAEALKAAAKKMQQGDSDIAQDFQHP